MTKPYSKPYDLYDVMVKIFNDMRALPLDHVLSSISQ